MSTFWNCTRKPSKRKKSHAIWLKQGVGLVEDNFIQVVSRVDIACPTTFLYPYKRKLL
jgi:hypothetical protein